MISKSSKQSSSSISSNASKSKPTLELGNKNPTSAEDKVTPTKSVTSTAVEAYQQMIKLIEQKTQNPSIRLLVGWMAFFFLAGVILIATQDPGNPEAWLAIGFVGVVFVPLIAFFCLHRICIVIRDDGTYTYTGMIDFAGRVFYRRVDGEASDLQNLLLRMELYKKHDGPKKGDLDVYFLAGDRHQLLLLGRADDERVAAICDRLEELGVAPSDRRDEPPLKMLNTGY